MYPQIPDDCSHNNHLSSKLIFTFPWRKYWERKDGIITGCTCRHIATDTHARIHTRTHTALTVLSPYVIIFSLWVVVGLCHCLLGCSVNWPSVQQLLLLPWHHAFGCQLLGLLGKATEFLGIRLLIGQHTRGRG